MSLVLERVAGKRLGGRRKSPGRRRAARVALALLLTFAQSGCGSWPPWRGGTAADRKPAPPEFSPGFNLFSPEQDVELGRKSAAQIAREVPLLRDEEVVSYVRSLGARLAERAPGDEFPYRFEVVASGDINAFALPGGFIFVNAGAIAAAKNEGELAGVLAHEIMHVALRHGTNQVSKAYLAKAGLGVLGALAGSDNPDLAQVIEAAGGAGANVLFLKFGRTAERQSDLGGARVMAEAGYDPRDMAAFFQTLQAEGGRRVPEFLSDHPDPGNRVASINEVVPALEVSQSPTRTSPEFARAQARLSGRALSSSPEPARKGPPDPADTRPRSRPEPPSDSFVEFLARDGSLSFEHPSNWGAPSPDDAGAELVFAPGGAHGRRDGVAYVTHGLFVGFANAEDGADLESATRSFVGRQLEANPDFRVAAQPRPLNLAGRAAYQTALAGPSPATGVTETDFVYTAVTSDGRLFYLITVAPEDEMGAYRGAFERVVASLRLR